jgi:hypothetical protein
MMAMAKKIKTMARDSDIVFKVGSGVNGKQPVDNNKRIVPVYPPLPHKGVVKTNLGK